VDRALIGDLLGHGAKGVTDRHYIKKSLHKYRQVIAKLPLPETLGWLQEDGLRALR
jgi:hypothetical protein